MKINYTMFGIGVTGGTIVILEIANRLVERGHRVTITTLGSPSDTKRFSLFPLKAEIHYTESFLEKAIRFGIRKIFNRDPLYPKRYIKKLTKSIPECDINVATFCFTAFSVLESKKGIPLYHMQHHEVLFFDDSYLKKLIEETYRLPLNKIANSTWLKNQIESIYGAKNLPVINPAINHTIFNPLYSVKKNKKRKQVVALGKTTEWKGLSDLFQAMKIVEEKRKDIELVLFGCNSLPQEYKRYRVPYKCLGLLVNEDLARLYRESDLLVCPSWYESFPLPPLEAMACGTPVVTTRYGTEDYAFDRENALVVSPRDPQAMAEAILRILEDENLANQLRENGLKTAKQFTWDKTVDKVEALFHKILKH